MRELAAIEADEAGAAGTHRMSGFTGAPSYQLRSNLVTKLCIHTTGARSSAYPVFLDGRRSLELRYAASTAGGFLQRNRLSPGVVWDPPATPLADWRHGGVPLFGARNRKQPPRVLPPKTWQLHTHTRSAAWGAVACARRRALALARPHRPRVPCRAHAVSARPPPTTTRLTLVVPPVASLGPQPVDVHHRRALGRRRRRVCDGLGADQAAALPEGRGERRARARLQGHACMRVEAGFELQQ